MLPWRLFWGEYCAPPIFFHASGGSFSVQEFIPRRNLPLLLSTSAAYGHSWCAYMRTGLGATRPLVFQTNYYMPFYNYIPSYGAGFIEIADSTLLQSYWTICTVLVRMSKILPYRPSACPISTSRLTTHFHDCPFIIEDSGDPVDGPPDGQLSLSS